MENKQLLINFKCGELATINGQIKKMEAYIENIINEGLFEEDSNIVDTLDSLKKRYDQVVEELIKLYEA